MLPSTAFGILILRLGRMPMVSITEVHSGQPSQGILLARMVVLPPLWRQEGMAALRPAISPPRSRRIGSARGASSLPPRTPCPIPMILLEGVLPDWTDLPFATTLLGRSAANRGHATFPSRSTTSGVRRASISSNICITL